MVRVGDLSPWILLGTAFLILVGFGFKVSVVPFHFWSPDVYEGAPTPITAFISTASKAAGFAVLLRFMLAAFPMIEAYWTMLLAILAAATMTLGNLLAIPQKNIKRLLAYSSVVCCRTQSQNAEFRTVCVQRSCSSHSLHMALQQHGPEYSPSSRVSYSLKYDDISCSPNSNRLSDLGLDDMGVNSGHSRHLQTSTSRSR